MGYALLTVELVLVFVLTAGLLNKYGNFRRQHLIVSVSTFVGWYFSFIIIFVLPLDIAITFYNRCVHHLQHPLSTRVPSLEFLESSAGAANESVCEKPGGYVPDPTLLSLWRVVYWTSQLLTWLVLPLMQSYVSAGDFTTIGRAKSALFNNAIYYGIYMIVFMLILVYAVIKGVLINAEHLKVILVSASNTWGLFLLVLLLGYGLIELPRSLWFKGSRNYRLNKTYFNIDKVAMDKHDAEDAVKDSYREARSAMNVVRNEPMAREMLQVILSKFPDEVVDNLFPARNSMEFAPPSGLLPTAVSSENYLITLHRRSIAAVQAHHRTMAQWRYLVAKAKLLEDISHAELTGNLSTEVYSWCPQSLRYAWLVLLQRPCSKVLAVWLGFMTCFIVISECTFFIVSPTLSPAALLVDYAAQRFHYKYTQFVAVGIIFYLCSCAYFSVFRLKIYKYYHLDPRGNTDENSLLFSAILLCRLTPPICLNFLGMVHLDSHITRAKDLGVETQFTKLMGHLDVLPILSTGLNIYLPMCILLFCAITYYRLGARLMHVLGFDQFMSDDEFTMDMVQSGKSMVQLERGQTRRREQRAQRQHTFTQRIAERQRAEDRIPIIQSDDEDDHAFSSLRLDTDLPRSPQTIASHPPTNFFDDL